MRQTSMGSSSAAYVAEDKHVVEPVQREHADARELLRVASSVSGTAQWRGRQKVESFGVAMSNDRCRTAETMWLRERCGVPVREIRTCGAQPLGLDGLVVRLTSRGVADCGLAMPNSA